MLGLTILIQFLLQARLCFKNLLQGGIKTVSQYPFMIFTMYRSTLLLLVVVVVAMVFAPVNLLFALLLYFTFGHI